MRAAIFNGRRSISVGERPEPATAAPSRRRLPETAFSIGRPGSMVGYVGVPHGVEPFAQEAMDERRAIKSLVRVGMV
jgi:hypothetical protein